MATMIIRSEKNPNFYKMPDGFGHYFGRLQSGRLWGQISLILFLTRLSIRWASLEPTHPFGLGDLAYEDGRAMGDHKSHFDGRAADIFPIHKVGVRRNDKQNMIAWNSENYDLERTTKLAKLIADLRGGFPMQEFRFNDRKVIKEVKTVPLIQEDTTTDWKKRQHDEHIHILLTGQHPFSKEEVELRLKMDWYYPE